MRGKAGKYRHRRQAMNTFSPCCISDAPLILRESLEASTFWWMTGPLVADPETSTWDSRAGGWKQNNRLADVSALLLGSTRLCIYNIAAWKLLPQACSGTTGCWWYILTVMEPLFFQLDSSSFGHPHQLHIHVQNKQCWMFCKCSSYNSNHFCINSHFIIINDS